MKERFRQKEIPATEAEIKQAVEGWWAYLDRKMQVHPHLRGGISHDIVYDKGVPAEETGTINLSLVDTIAPELAGLGKLVSAKIPHVYVEGTRNPNIVVRFDDIYTEQSRDFVFRADPKDKLLMYLKQHGILPDLFLLYISSDSDMDQHGQRISDITVMDLVFLTSADNVMRGYTLKGGWLSVYLNPLQHAYRVDPRIRGLLMFSMRKHTEVKPVTQSEIEIVKTGFSNALSALG